MGSLNAARLLAASLLVASFPHPSPGAPPPGVEMDPERGEVRFPCRFVNPTRLLEVFACHRTGPTHETVLEFDAFGPDIYRALLGIGCRPSSYWNATSPDDFQKTQGDRILVLVRWERANRTEEHPAEGMLIEGETGYPSPVRGFSFGARGAFKVDVAGEERGAADNASDGDAVQSEEEKRRAAEVKATGVPAGVEISLGALLRQTQPHTLLSHPTSSARVQPWMVAPFLDSRVVKEHRELIEKQVPATLILRRIRNEAELVEVARATAARRGVAGTDALYARVEPIAREIDALKGEYEALRTSLGAIVEPKSGAAESSGDATQAAADRVKAMVQRGQWICAKIEERYLSIYALEEEHKAAWVEKQADMPPEVREEALVLARDGLRFEPRIAAKQVELAALDLAPAAGPPGEAGLRRKRISAEIDAIVLERNVALSKANARGVEAKIAELKDSDPYVRRLFEEDLRRSRATVDLYAAQLRIALTDVQELGGLLDGSWDAIQASVTKERDAAKTEIERAQRRLQIIDIEEEIRWTEGDEQSDDPARRAEATTKLQQLRKQKAALEKN